MRIQPGQLIHKLIEVYRGQKAPRQDAAGPAQSGKADAVELSQAAQDILALRDKMAQASPARAARIQAIKREIESGTYQPDARAIADKLLKQNVAED